MADTTTVGRSYPFGPIHGLVIDPTYFWLQEHEPLARVRLPYGEEGWLLTDVELSGGTVPAGQPVLLAKHAANRDPRRYADPDRLDITRDAQGHLGFGHGAHHCLGAPLARMDIQTALTAL